MRYTSFFVLDIWPAIFTFPQEGWPLQPTLILQEFTHFKASASIVCRVLLAWAVPPLFCGSEVSNLCNSICYIGLKSAILIVNVVQGDNRISLESHSFEFEVSFRRNERLTRAPKRASCNSSRGILSVLIGAFLKFPNTNPHSTVPSG